MGSPMTNDQAQTIADAIESLSFNASQIAEGLDALGYNCGERRAGPGALEGAGHVDGR